MAERSKTPRLVVRAANTPEEVFPLAQPVVRIGRSPRPQNDLVLSDSAVSRAHCRIYCDREPFRIQDVGSSNGTALNDQPLAPNELHPLSDGDVIAIGPFRLTYLASPPRPIESAQPPQAEHALEPAASAASGAAPPPPPGGPSPKEPGHPEPWPGMTRTKSRWLQHLPPIYAEHEFLGRFLLPFEDLMSPVDQIIAHFDLYLDPETCPEDFMPILAEWLGLDLAERWPLEVRRQLVKHGAWLHRARGTVPGLRRHLEICTGGQIEIRENVDRPHTLNVHIRDTSRRLHRPLLDAVVQYHLPAHVAYRLTVEQTPTG